MSLTTAQLMALVAVLVAAAMPLAIGPADDLTIATGTGPGMVVVADFNNDGHPDLAIANEGSGDVSVFLGESERGLSGERRFPAGPNPNDIAVGDFNRDHALDLAIANHETQRLSVLLGDGRGGFAPPSGAGVTVLVKPHVHGLAAGDLNGDGNFDLVTDSWGEDRLEIVFGDGAGGFTRPGVYLPVGPHPYQRVRVADLNADGHADIVSPNLDGDSVTILLGDGRGRFRQPAGSPFPAGDAPFGVAVGDVTADGVLDLAIVDSPSSTPDHSGRDGLTILIGDGRGTFTPMTGSPFPTPRRPNFAAIGDVNGDGVGDVVISNPDSDTITIVAISRRGLVTSQSTLAVRGHPKGLAVRDLNGDSRADLVITNNVSNTVTIRWGH